MSTYLKLEVWMRAFLFYPVHGFHQWSASLRIIKFQQGKSWHGRYKSLRWVRWFQDYWIFVITWCTPAMSKPSMNEIGEKGAMGNMSPSIRKMILSLYIWCDENRTVTVRLKTSLPSQYLCKWIWFWLSRYLSRKVIISKGSTYSKPRIQEPGVCGGKPWQLSLELPRSLFFPPL